MIRVTRLNHSSIVLNDELIEHIDSTPDTVIAMNTGQTFTVLESPEDIVGKIRTYRRSLLSPDALQQSSQAGADTPPQNSIPGENRGR